jgi:hypothetical protein
MATAGFFFPQFNNVYVHGPFTLTPVTGLFSLWEHDNVPTQKGRWIRIVVPPVAGLSTTIFQIGRGSTGNEKIFLPSNGSDISLSNSFVIRWSTMNQDIQYETSFPFFVPAGTDLSVRAAETVVFPPVMNFFIEIFS